VLWRGCRSRSCCTSGVYPTATSQEIANHRFHPNTVQARQRSPTPIPPQRQEEPDPESRLDSQWSSPIPNMPCPSPSEVGCRPGHQGQGSSGTHLGSCDRRFPARLRLGHSWSGRNRAIPGTCIFRRLVALPRNGGARGNSVRMCVLEKRNRCRSPCVARGYLAFCSGLTSSSQKPGPLSSLSDPSRVGFVANWSKELLVGAAVCSPRFDLGVCARRLQTPVREQFDPGFLSPFIGAASDDVVIALSPERSDGAVVN
jgi:hypothetical protein